MPTDIEESVRDIEVELYGTRGGGGLVRSVERLGKEIDGLRTELHGWREEERKRREAEREDAREERKKDLRWRVTTVLTLLGLIVSVVVAAQIIASSL